MFESHEHPQSLDEEIFNNWLENGRSSKLGYHYMLVVWDSYESAYRPIYIEERDAIEPYRESATTTSPEKLVAVYDLYSESRIL